LFWVRSSSRGIADGEQYRGIEGILTDITDRKTAEMQVRASERRYRNVFESASDAMLVLDKDTGAVLDANSAAFYLYKYTREELLGLHYADLLAESGPSSWAPRPGPGFGPILYHQRKDHSVFPAEVSESMYAQKKRVISIVSVRNITGRKEAEERIVTARRMYTVISRINQAIVRIRDLETLLQEICRIIVDYGQFRMVWVGLVDKENGKLRPVAHAGFEEGYLAAVDSTMNNLREGHGPAVTAINGGNAVISDDIATDAGMASWRTEALERGYCSTAAFPFSLHGEVVGVITIYAPESNFFTPGQVEILGEITGDVSFALNLLDEQARRSRAEKALAGSEEKAEFLARILELSSQPFCITDPAWRFTLVNPALCDLLGYSDAEFRDLSWDGVTPPEYRETDEIALRELIRTGLPQRYEKEFGKKDGTRVQAEVFTHRFTDSGGNIRNFYSFITDITDRKNAERAIQRAKTEWETIFSAIGNPTVILDPDQTILEANDIVIQLTGKTLANLRTMKCWQIFHGPDCSTPPAGCPFAKMKGSGNLETASMEVQAFGGIYLVSCTPVSDEHGNLEKIIHIATDITALRCAEEALREREEHYRVIFECSTDAVMLIGDTIADCNPKAERTFGCSREEIIGHDFLEFSPEFQPDGKSSREAAAALIKDAREGANLFFPWQYRKKDGSAVNTEVSLTLVTMGGQRHCLIAIIHDVTARRCPEETSRENEAWPGLITDLIPDMVWVVDRDLVPFYVSPSVSRQLLYTPDELTNIPLSRQLAPESCRVMWQLMNEFFTSGEVKKDLLLSTNVELEFLRKDGTTFWSENLITPVRDDTGNPVRLIGVGRDITERRNAENQIRRLASFPQMNPDPVIELNLQKEITFFNPACIEILKKLDMPDNPAAFLPQDIDAVIEHLAEEKFPVLYREVAVGEALFGESLALSPGSLAIRIFAHDITGHVQLARALERANRKLNLLTGITRHDIRNRLTGVLGYLELAKGSTKDPTLLDYLSRSESAAVVIRQQIDFTKEYENIGGKVPAWQRISAIIEDMKKQFNFQAVEISNDTGGLSIYADPMFLKVIYNLIDNALRHGGDGLSRIWIHGNETSEGYVLVFENDGSGIPIDSRRKFLTGLSGRILQ
jgi:PAS domain S-box-containing protein